MGMSIDIRIANNSEAREWDQMVEASPNGTIFHTWEWIKIMEKHTGTKLYPIIGFKGHTPIGVFPIFYQKKHAIKMVFSPPPHASVLYLGPALPDYEKMKQSKKESAFLAFHDKVNDFINSELKASYISISTSPGLLDSRPLTWSGYQVEPRFNYLTDLSGGADHIWQQFKKNLRQDIERTRRKGITIEEGSKKEVIKVHELLVKRYKDQGKTVSDSKEYLLDLFKTFSKVGMRVLVAKYQGDIVTGLIDVHYKDKVTSWIGNLKSNMKKVSPNDLINWEAMKWACDNGYKYYETMGAASVKRLHSYYSKWSSGLLVWFLARKYPSITSKILESSYLRILKPTYSRLKSKRG